MNVGKIFLYLHLSLLEYNELFAVPEILSAWKSF